jgi:uncharacterized protein (TIGR02300 family)
MSKPAKGTKRVCPSCGARFYDLNRTPISCPLCQAVYQVPVAVPRRNERAQPAEVKKPEEAKAPPVVAKAVSAEEAEEAGVEADDVSEDEDIDLGDDAPEIPPGGDDDDTFLEDDEEEGETEVAKIVPKSGEES